MFHFLHVFKRHVSQADISRCLCVFKTHIVFVSVHLIATKLLYKSSGHISRLIQFAFSVRQLITSDSEGGLDGATFTRRSAGQFKVIFFSFLIRLKQERVMDHQL